MRFIEVERLLLKDGWRRKDGNGSHHHYVHNTKPGKITVPNHPGDINKNIVRNIFKAAGLI